MRGRRAISAGPRGPQRLSVEVRGSAVHGKGLFARKRLRRGAWIGRFEGKRTQRDGPHVLWLEDDDGTSFGLRGENALRFLNHSRSPNAEFRGDQLYAIRNIQPDAEIFFDYGPEWADVD